MFLQATVIDSKSKCTFTEDDIVFELEKATAGQWKQLEADLARDEKRKLREQLIEKAHEKAATEGKRKKGICFNHMST